MTIAPLSVNASDGVETMAFMARVNLTFNYNLSGCKGNTTGEFIHDTSVTFEQVLRNLLPNIALNEISNPEICILLARKQFCWPVVFGTDSGNWQPTDVRATNLQEAVTFAKKWELYGVALASEPFALTPHTWWDLLK
ncbi:hypothetical protein MMC31_003972 [Peltigera leucophlebia]|nr:hypothetical protein [Peltigera leucophlebia]